MRETRHLWVGNLPENAREEKIADHFRRYGRVEKVKILSKRSSSGTLCAVVAFVDIRSAQKAQNTVNIMGDCHLQTSYSEPAAMSSSSRQKDLSPSSSRHSLTNYKHHPPANRSDNSRSFDGHGGDRSYAGDRYRSHGADSRGQDYPESKGVHRMQKESRGYDSGGSSNLQKSSKEKKSKLTPSKIAKKKPKKLIESPKVMKRTIKHKERGRSPTIKKKVTKKKKIGSSSDEDAVSSSSGSSASSSNSSASSSVTSSRSNSSASSSSGGSMESEPGGQKKLVTMIINKLPSRPSVNSLRDGIYHEFKKCGKVKSVMIRGGGGDNNNRHALVLFRTAAEAMKSVNHTKTKLLFGAAIEASIYEGEVSGKELQECGGIIDEFHPRASRTLFVGNLDKTVGYSDIQNIFVRFGEIVAIEIKKQNNIPQYAFLQYTNIASVVKAIQKMDGERLGKNTLKLGFGKTVMSSCIWIEGVTDSFTEHYLASCFQKFGAVEHVVIDRSRGQALVFYSKYEHAQQSISNMRGRKLNGSRLKLDYASQELIELFLSHMRSSGQNVMTFESIRHLLLPAPSAPGLPPPNPTSTSSRASSSYPYSGGDNYYDDLHHPRYPHHGPPGYDVGVLPPRGDWRGWDDRNRSRSIYHGTSPRGRRYKDDRGEYYRREGEYYDRIPGYDQDFRSQDYLRREHGREYSTLPPRDYDDYHRMKSRERRDPPHHLRAGHSPLSRGMQRRSRSISPKSTASSGRGRVQDYNLKAEQRMKDRDNSAPYTRSPARSPGSRDGRKSGSDSLSKRYRDQPHHHAASPLPSARGDERRVELRDSKLTAGSSPCSESVKSEVVDNSMKMGESWSGTELTKSNIDANTNAWSPAGYDRSRSETPTRDENLDSIGEIIIKQPTASLPRTGKRNSEDKQSRREKSTSKSRNNSQASSIHSDQEVDNTKLNKNEDARGQEHLLQRMHSSSSSDGAKMKRREATAKSTGHKNENKSKSHHVASPTDSFSGHVGKKQKLQHSTKNKPDWRHSGSKNIDFVEKARNVNPAKLIKREYSPTSGAVAQKVHRKRSLSSEQGQERKERQSKKTEQFKEGGLETSEIQHKKRRRSEDIRENESDSGTSHSPTRKERRISDSTEHREKGSNKSGDLELHGKSTKRIRRASVKHEAPMSVASQSFMDNTEEDNSSVLSEEREPPSEFQHKIVLKEEVVEVSTAADSPDSSVEEDVTEMPTSSDPPTQEKRKSRWEPEVVPAATTPKTVPPKIAIAQPFHTGFQPYQPLVAARPVLPTHADTAILNEAPNVQVEPKVEKLTILEREKARLEKLLYKLDTDTKLAENEANEVADVVMEDIANKIKQKQAKKHKKASEVPGVASEESVEVQTSTVVSEEEPKIADINEVVEEGTPIPLPGFEENIDLPEVIEEHTIVEEEITAEFVSDFSQGDETLILPTDLRDSVEVEINAKDVDARQGYRKQMEAKRKELERLKEKEERRKEKECRSLLRKQTKERDRHKQKVEQMRGPSQKIVSSVIDEEESSDIDAPEESYHSNDHDNLTASIHDNQFETEVTLQDASSLPRSEIDSEETVYEEENELVESSDQKGDDEVVGAVKARIEVPEERSLSESLSCSYDFVLAPPSQISQSSPCEVDIVSGLSNESLATKQHSRVAPTSTAQSGSNISGVSPSVFKSAEVLPISSSKLEGLSKASNSKTPNKTSATSSPYTPKSTSSVGKLSQVSRQSSSSRTNTPSPSVRTHPQHRKERSSSSRSNSSSLRNDHHGSSHSRRTHAERASEDKRRKAEQAKNTQRRKQKPATIDNNSFTNLTVSSNVSASEPLGKKELERLKAELCSMKQQLSIEMSPGFLSPSSDTESSLPPISPILKSPQQETNLTPDILADGKIYRKNSGASPMIAFSPSVATSPAINMSPALSSSSSYTDRMKLIGKVKKKKLDDNATASKMKETSKSLEQKDFGFRTSRPMRTSIFDQDSARLSHLQNPAPSETELMQSGLLSKFLDPNDLPVDKPFFSSFAEKAASKDSLCSPYVVSIKPTNTPSESQAKNESSLSSSSTFPASAEGTLNEIAGKEHKPSVPTAASNPFSEENFSLQPTSQQSVDDVEHVAVEISTSVDQSSEVATEVSANSLNHVESNPSEMEAKSVDVSTEASSSTANICNVTTQSCSDVFAVSSEADVSENSRKVYDQDKGKEGGEVACSESEIAIKHDNIITQFSMVAEVESEANEHKGMELGVGITQPCDVVEHVIHNEEILSDSDESIVYEAAPDVIATEVVHDDNLVEVPNVDEGLQEDIGLLKNETVETTLANSHSEPSVIAEEIIAENNSVKDEKVLSLSESLQDSPLNSEAIPVKSETFSDEIEQISVATEESKQPPKLESDKLSTSSRIKDSPKVVTVESKTGKAESNPAYQSENKAITQGELVKKPILTSQPPSTSKQTNKDVQKERKVKIEKKHKTDKSEKSKKDSKIHKKPHSSKDNAAKAEVKQEKHSSKLGDNVNRASSGKAIEKPGSKKAEKAVVKSEKHKTSGELLLKPVLTSDFTAKNKTVEPKAESTSSKLGKSLAKQDSLKSDEKPHKSSSKFTTKVPDKEQAPTSEVKVVKSLEKSKVQEEFSKLPDRKTADAKSVDKKVKATAPDVDKKKENKSHKLQKDKDLKSTHSSGKKHKGNDSNKDKHKSSSVLKPQVSVTKKSSGSKSVTHVKKSKDKGKDSPAYKSQDRVKSSSKHKHQKLAMDVEQPAKKKPRLEDAKELPIKKMKSAIHSSSSEEEEDQSIEVNKKQAPALTQPKAKPKSNIFSDEGLTDSDSSMKEQIVKKSTKHAEVKPKPITDIGRMSEDSESSDNYDSFVSQMNKSSPKKSGWLKGSSTSKQQSIYSSTDSSDESDASENFNMTKLETKKQEIASNLEFLKHEQRFDSDKSDKSVSRPSKSGQENVKSKLKDKKGKFPKDKISSNVLKKSSSKTTLSSERKIKLKHKEKKLLKSSIATRVSDAESKGKSSKEVSSKKSTKPVYETGSDKSFDEQDISKQKKSKHSNTFKKHRPGTKSQEVVDSSAKDKKAKTKVYEKERRNRTVSSSSSSSSQNYPPPSPPSSFLTTETLRDETVFSREYMNPFSTLQESDQKSRVKSVNMNKGSEKWPKSEESHYAITSSSDVDSDSDLNTSNKPGLEGKLNFPQSSASADSDESSDIDENDELFRIISSRKVSSEPKPKEKIDISQNRLKPSKVSADVKKEEPTSSKDPQKDSNVSLKPSKISNKASEHKKDISKSSLKHHTKEKPQSPSQDTSNFSKILERKADKKKLTSDNKCNKDKTGSSITKGKVEQPHSSMKHAKKSKTTDEKRTEGVQSKTEDRHSSERGKKLLDKSSSKSEKISKHHEAGMSGNKEHDKSHKVESQDVIKTGKHSQDKHKQHRDMVESTRHKLHSGLKAKAKEPLGHKHSKTTSAPQKDNKESKSSKSKQAMHDSGASLHKKSQKSKIYSSEVEQKNTEQKLKVPSDKNEKKKSPKPEVLPAASFETGKHVTSTKSDNLTQKEEEKFNENLPGRSFFSSDSSDNENVSKQNKVPEQPSISVWNKAFGKPSIEEKGKEIDSSKAKVKGLQQSPSKHHSPLPKSPGYKSMFSPNPREDISDAGSLIAVIKSGEGNTMKVEESKAEDHQKHEPEGSKDTKVHGLEGRSDDQYEPKSPTKQPKSFVQGKSEKDVSDERVWAQSGESRALDAEEKTLKGKKQGRRSRSHSRDHSPAERSKRLSSYERYQIEQERHREEMKRLKQLSQKRDEEAVRSIMSSDETQDYLSSGGFDYFSNQGKLSEKEKEAPVAKEEYETLTSVIKEKTVPVPEVTEHLSSMESKESSKNPSPEPRSTAEEIELAAAVSSIEFGFGEVRRDAVSTEEPTFPSAVFGVNVATEQNPQNITDEQKQEYTAKQDEAALAASALMQESNSNDEIYASTSFTSPHKEYSWDQEGGSHNETKLKTSAAALNSSSEFSSDPSTPQELSKETKSPTKKGTKSSSYAEVRGSAKMQISIDTEKERNESTDDFSLTNTDVLPEPVIRVHEAPSSNKIYDNETTQGPVPINRKDKRALDAFENPVSTKNSGNSASMNKLQAADAMPASGDSFARQVASSNKLRVTPAQSELPSSHISSANTGLSNVKAGLEMTPETSRDTTLVSETGVLDSLATKPSSTLQKDKFAENVKDKLMPEKLISEIKVSSSVMTQKVSNVSQVRPFVALPSMTHTDVSSASESTDIKLLSQPIGVHADLPRLLPSTPRKSGETVTPSGHTAEPANPASGGANVHVRNPQAFGVVGGRTNSLMHISNQSVAHRTEAYAPTPYMYCPTIPGQPPQRQGFLAPGLPATNTQHAFMPPTNISSGAFKIPPTQVSTTGMQGQGTGQRFAVSPQSLTGSPKNIASPSLPSASSATNTSRSQQQFSFPSKDPHSSNQMHSPHHASIPSSQPIWSHFMSATNFPSGPHMPPRSTASPRFSSPPVTQHPPLVVSRQPTYLTRPGFEPPSSKSIIQVPLYSPPVCVATSVKATIPQPATKPPEAALGAQPRSAVPVTMATAPSIPPTPANSQGPLSVQASNPTGYLTHYSQMPGHPLRQYPTTAGNMEGVKLPTAALKTSVENETKLPPTLPPGYHTSAMFLPRVPQLPYAFPTHHLHPGMTFPPSPYASFILNSQRQRQPAPHVLPQQAFPEMPSIPPNQPVMASTKAEKTRYPVLPNKGRVTPGSSAGHPKPSPSPQASGHSPHVSGTLPRASESRTSYLSQGETTSRSSAMTPDMAMIAEHFRLSGVQLPSSTPLPSSSAATITTTLSNVTTRHMIPGFPQQSYPPELRGPLSPATCTTASLKNPVSSLPHEMYHHPSHNLAKEMHHQIPSPHSQWIPASPSVPMSVNPSQQIDSYHRSGGSSRSLTQSAASKQPQEHQQEDKSAEQLQDLFTRYPVIWQGRLALKNDCAAVQVHYVCGNPNFGQAGFPKQTDSSDANGLAVLRIIQRMRILPPQIEGLKKRMLLDTEFCLLVALPCGRDKDDVMRQTSALRSGFIEYLEQKQVAGIVNVNGVLESTHENVTFVLHIFPPCEFATENLQRRAPDLLANMGDIHHLVIVITTA